MNNILSFRDLVNKSVFLNRDILFSKTPPGGFIHRDEQKNEMILELSKIITHKKPCFMFLYGPPGTGKTALMKELELELDSVASENNIKINSFYLNCSEYRTENSIMCGIMNKINPSGHLISRVKYKDFVDNINKKYENQQILITLDEIDFALKESGDDFLYNLAILNEKANSSISIVFISNDLKVYDYIKPRTQQLIGKLKIIFPPYNAEELKQIIYNRTKLAFKKDVLKEETIDYIAKKEAERKGDARSALELIDACGKLATQKNLNEILPTLVKEAELYLEKNSILTKIPELSKHHKLVFLTIIDKSKKEKIGSEIYKEYLKLSKEYGIKPVSERRVRTLVSYLDEVDLIYTKVHWIKELNKKSKEITLPFGEETKNKAVDLLKETI